MSKVKDPLIDNKNFYNFETNFLHYFGWVSKITVVLFLIGFFQQKPTLFISFNFIVKIGLALFLIYRFNNYRKYEITFTDLDRKVCYSAGLYILFISFADLINSYMDQVKKIISPYTENIVISLKQMIMNT
jgi:ABC-type multidrug transport system fused ATPase/permease subunit